VARKGRVGPLASERENPIGDKDRPTNNAFLLLSGKVGSEWANKEVGVSRHRVTDRLASDNEVDL